MIIFLKASNLIDHIKKHKTAYLFILPSLIFTILFTWYPIFYGVWMSFHDFYLKPITNPEFVFLDNYIKLFNDRVFILALKNSIMWVCISVPTNFLLAFGVALLLNEKIGRSRNLFRSVILFSWASPWVVSGLVWRWLYNSQWGIINKMLLDLGIIGSSVSFLSEPSLVWFSILVYFWWSHLSFECLSLLAALQTVPTSLYDAARVDGANTFQRLRHVTLPVVRPTVVTLLLLAIVWGLNNFGTIWSLTFGGPGRVTEVLPTYAYRTSFKIIGGMHLGRSAAICVIIFLIELIFVIMYVRRVVKT